MTGTYAADYRDGRLVRRTPAPTAANTPGLTLRPLSGVAGWNIVPAAPLPQQPPGVVVLLPWICDLQIMEGDDVEFDLLLWTEQGAAELSNVTAQSQIRLTPDADDPPLAEFTCTLIDGQTVRLHLPHAQNRDMPTTAAVWDVQLTFAVMEADQTPGSRIYTFAAGTVTWRQEVTRP
jgi:hypothetical protein